MVFIKYRQSTTAAVPGSTTAKAAPLTNLEMDGNFKSISNAIDDLTTHATIVDDTTLNATVYPMWATAAGYLAPNISTTKIRYNPNTDTLTCLNFNGNAATVTTNANLTGMVTSVGNTTTVVTNANLTGMVTSVGNATTVVTNANLTGDVTSVGNTTNIANTVVTSKLLTGFTAGSGSVSATDTILEALQKLAANDGTNADLTGMVTSVGNTTTVVTNAAMTGEATSDGITNAVTLTNSAVIGKVLTGFTSGTGTITASDTLLTAIQKLYGNDALKAPLASPTFTGVPAVPTAAVDVNTTQAASTAFVLGQAAATSPLANGLSALVGSSTRYARADHVHPSTTPTFRAYLNTSDQGLTSAAAPVVVQFNTKSFDTVTGYSTGTYRWTPGVAGYYTITSGLQIAGGAISTLTIQIVKNTTVESAKTITGTSLNPAGVIITDTIQAGATDTFEIRIGVTGSSPSVTADITGTYFTGTLVSRG